MESRKIFCSTASATFPADSYLAASQPSLRSSSQHGFSIALFAVLAAAGVSASAQNVTWTGATGGTWTVGSNWSGGSAPTSSNAAFLSTGGRNIWLPDNSNVTVDSLTISATGVQITGTGSNANRSINSTLTINNGLTYTSNVAITTYTRIDTISLGNSQTWNVGGPTSTSPITATGPQFIGTGSTVMAFNLNGNTLTKTGTGMLSIGGVSIGNGDIDVSQGALRIAVSSTLPASVTGSGTVSVQPGASLFLGATAAGSGSPAFTFTKPVRMVGGLTSGSAAVISFGSTNTNTRAGSQTIASDIDWDGFSALNSVVSSTSIIQNWTFSGNFTGSGTIQIGSLASSASSSALRFSGNNSGFTGLVDNQISSSNLNRPVVFVGANAGSANAEWRVTDYRSRYWLDGSSVQLGALSSGTTGTLTLGGTTALIGNFSATTSATATIGGKGIDTQYAGLLVDGSAASLAITKVGAGTLTLSNTNTYTGLTDVQAGRILYGINNALGSGAVQVSGGTLDVSSFSDSVGAVTLTSGTIAGTSGVLTGSSYDVRGGAVTAILGGSGIGLTKSTAGTVTLGGVNTYSGVTTVSAGTLKVDGSIAASSGVGVAGGATLGGSGAVSVISGEGLVSPGNSPGILTATSIDPTTGIDFAFELTGTGSPLYGSPTNSVNDVLRLTSATPSLEALTLNNVVSVYFGSSILDAGDVFRGGTYVDLATTPEARDAFATSIAGADWQYFVLGDGQGLNPFGGSNYYTLAQYNAATSSNLTITRTVVADTADFGTGSLTGAVTQFVVVPEPATICLLGVASVAMALRLRSAGRRA
jgi:fibronectin-binding autotransporter adhesin